MSGRVLVVGSNNPDKLAEIGAIMAGLPVELRPAGAYGPFDPAEDRDTLEGNAEAKAEAACRLSNEWAFADDTGLFVDALGGAPGVHSARYSAPDPTYEKNCRKLLDALAGVSPDARTARFICVIALARPGIPTLFFQGAIEGRIVGSPRGAGGFGYDPLFFAPELGMTFAEASAELKNGVSHRFRALAALREELSKLLGRR